MRFKRPNFLLISVTTNVINVVSPAKLVVDHKTLSTHKSLHYLILEAHQNRNMDGPYFI